MRFVLPLLCLSVFYQLATPAFAAGSIIVSPVYSQLVALPVPSNFVAGNEQAKDGFYILELAPKGETMEVWSQLITLTGAQGGATNTTVAQVAAQIGEGYKAACPATFAARALPAPKVRGASVVFAGFLGCGSVDGHSEAMVFLVMQGKSEIYTVQWAERGKAQDKPMAADPSVWRPRADALALTRVCDKVAGEKAPYPSCTE